MTSSTLSITTPGLPERSQLTWKMKKHEGFTVVIAGLAILFYPSISRAGDALMGNNASEATHVVVDKSGNGDFRRIQDAIDAVPSNNSQQVFISIKPGTYRLVQWLP